MISEERKTSNGCEVAKCVPRESAGCLPESNYIAAIDFGTTNCSVAYILPGEMNEQGPVLLPFDGTYYRVPTAVLFNANGAVRSFGTTARRDYRNLEDDERLKCPYFEEIKMNLQHDEFVDRKMKVKAKNNKEYFLVEVIAHILKYLKDELIRALKASGINLKATDFDWVITVPAIWRARGKQMMREAGYKAGLCSRECCPPLLPASNIPQQIDEKQPDKLSLALEPESAAIFCQNMSQRQATTFCQAEAPSTASSYLVVDIGGGTVDISAHHLFSTPETHIKVIHPPTGNNCGGTKINKEFKKFLEELVRDPCFVRYLSTPNIIANAKHQAYFNELLNDTFEKQKVLLGGKDDISDSGTISFELPRSFIKTYLHDLQQSIAERGDSLVKLVDEQDLRISHILMKKFFKPTRDGIIQCICETLAEVQPIEKIYLVGGFGGSKYIVRAVKEEFGWKNIAFIVPVEPAYAVVRGAALYKQNPEIVKSRRADATYGLRSNISFIDGLHDPKYRWVNDDGKMKSKNIFSTIVERGDIVGTGEVFTNACCPAEHNQESMLVQFFSSPEKDIFYVTGEWGINSRKPRANVIKLGEISIQMPDFTGDKNRVVDVTFDFSHTEIKVRAFDRTSKNEVKTILNFLDSIE